MAICADNLDLQLDTNSFECAHRIVNHSVGKKHPIVDKFTQLKTKRSTCDRKLKGTNYSVTQDLNFLRAKYVQSYSGSFGPKPVPLN